MNALTKARTYLKKRNSKLQHLLSFGLILATAESDYRELLNIYNKRDGQLLPKNIEDRIADAALDYAAMLFLKRNRVLPKNIATAFKPGISSEEKKKLAAHWSTR